MGEEARPTEGRGAVGASYTKTQTARTSVRQARAAQLAQAAEREARIETAATAAVLAWDAREKAAERLATAEEHVSAQLHGLVVEKLSVSQIVALTGIPRRHCRTLIRDPAQHVPAADSRDVEQEGQARDVEGAGRTANRKVGDG